MAKEVFKGFKKVGPDYTTFENGYIYLIRTDTDGRTGHIYFNGKLYGNEGVSDFEELDNRPKYNGVAMTSATDIPDFTEAIEDIISALGGKVNEPEIEGTVGQVLATNGAGERQWITVSGGGGTSDFNSLFNRPKYNGVTMTSATDIPEVKPVMPGAGLVSDSEGVLSVSSTIMGSITVSSISNIPVTHRAVLATVSGSGTLSFASLPSVGCEVHVIIKNNGSSTISIALPSSGSYICTSVDTIFIENGKYGEANVLNINGTGYVHGISSI